MLATNRKVALSKRELDIVQLAANGLSDKEIAHGLGINMCTVRTYWERLRKRLGTTNRTQSVAVAISMGWIDVDLTDVMLKANLRMTA